MKDIYKLIVERFDNGMDIPLIGGGHYVFIETAATVINGINYIDAISYRISDTNTKRISRQFIELTYEFYISRGNNNVFPSVSWYLNHTLLSFEYKSRRCNKSVATGLILAVLN